MSSILPKLKPHARFAAGRLIRAAFLVLIPSAPVHAGPPFVTDDPEPVDYQHWEVYLASETQHTPGQVVGTLPHVEVNYGVVPDVQLHVIIPDAFNPSDSGARTFGLGSMELGVKYRFVQQTADMPEIATFPLVELPMESTPRGFGTGHTQLYLPLWAQKDFDKWTIYGGGGYWINPGPGNKNNEFVGVLIQCQLTKNFALGTEVYHQTSQMPGVGATSQLNAGFVWDLNDNEHILASAGPAIQGPHGYQTYLAFQWTFGPEKKTGEK